MRRILFVGILSIGILLAGLAFFMGERYRRATLIETTSNMKSLHIALLDFSGDYGSFPDASTMADVKAAVGTTLTLGSSSSNEIFRQLIATTAKKESFFWAKSTISPRKPDNNISGSHALEKGECGFAYVTEATLSGSLARPILLTPVDPAKRCFERRWDYNNMAVILFLDGSVKPFPIDQHGHVAIDGMDIFDPRQPFWGGKAPDVKWPE